MGDGRVKKSNAHRGSTVGDDQGRKVGHRMREERMGGAALECMHTHTLDLLLGLVSCSYG